MNYKAHLEYGSFGLLPMSSLEWIFSGLGIIECYYKEYASPFVEVLWHACLNIGCLYNIEDTINISVLSQVIIHVSEIGFQIKLLTLY